MFKHGVAYLERSGPADGPFALSFSDTLNHHRFKVTVPPHGRAAIKVVERWMGSQKFLYTAFSAADLQRWLEGRFLDESVSSELGGVLALRDRIREMPQQLDRATKDRDAAARRIGRPRRLARSRYPFGTCVAGGYACKTDRRRWRAGCLGFRSWRSSRSLSSGRLPSHPIRPIPVSGSPRWRPSSYFSVR